MECAFTRLVMTTFNVTKDSTPLIFASLNHTRLFLSAVRMPRKKYHHTSLMVAFGVRTGLSDTYVNNQSRVTKLYWSLFKMECLPSYALHYYQKCDENKADASAKNSPVRRTIGGTFEFKVHRVHTKISGQIWTQVRREANLARSRGRPTLL